MLSHPAPETMQHLPRDKGKAKAICCVLCIDNFRLCASSQRPANIALKTQASLLGSSVPQIDFNKEWIRKISSSLVIMKAIY